MSTCTIYVGGLSECVSDHQLRELFGSYGIVARAHVVRFKRTGKSAGYGFVEMSCGEQALNAVVDLEGSLMDGRRLRLYVTPT